MQNVKTHTFDKQKIWVDIKIWPRHNILRQLNGFSLICRDKTSEKYAEETKREKQLSEERERFATITLQNLAHNIKNPLQHAKSVVEALTSPNPTSNTEKMLKRLLLTIHALERQLQSKWDSIRYRGNVDFTPNKTYQCIQKTLSNVLDLYAESMNMTRLTFKITKLVPEIIEIDHARLEQVMSNLVDNAFKHGSKVLHLFLCLLYSLCVCLFVCYRCRDCGSDDLSCFKII